MCVPSALLAKTATEVLRSLIRLIAAGPGRDNPCDRPVWRYLLDCANLAELLAFALDISFVQERRAYLCRCLHTEKDSRRKHFYSPDLHRTRHYEMQEHTAAPCHCAYAPKHLC